MIRDLYLTQPHESVSRDMVKANKLRGHSFSIEMPSRNSINNLSINGGSTIEGDLGDNISFEIIEGIMLQISGENGVFRLDLREGESDTLLRSLKKGEGAPP
jgi:hypothetical protein